jgi:Flp pilus assembly pilin Flp
MVETTLRWLVIRFQGRGDRGASLVEYALLVALIALVAASALGYFQDETASTLSDASSAIVNAD